jgi:UDP-perosamine 4-acetyltransferase
MAAPAIPARRANPDHFWLNIPGLLHRRHADVDVSAHTWRPTASTTLGEMGRVYIVSPTVQRCSFRHRPSCVPVDGTPTTIRLVSTGGAPRVLLYGAGGHARVCLDTLVGSGHVVVGAVSRDGTGVEGLGVPVFGTDAELDHLTESENVHAICVAVGDNRDRSSITRNLTERGYVLTTAISTHAVVSPTASIGPGGLVVAAAVVNAATSIGRGVIVNTNATVDHDVVVGEFVHVAPGTAVGGGVTIGDRVLLGLGSRVLPGIRVVADAIVGAGAVVIDDVAPGDVVVGVPARPRT